MAELVDDRKGQLLAAGVTAARSLGWYKVTRKHIAEVTGTAPSLTNYYFPSKSELRDAIMEEAVIKGVVSVVAEGLVYGHPAATAAPAPLRAKAEAYVKAKDLKLPRWMVLTEAGAVHAWS